MAPENNKMVATLDSDELSFVRRLFKNGDVKSDGRISVAEMLACVKKMEFALDGSPEELVRSVVPSAVEVDRLSLNDAIKVASAAKAQDLGSAAPEAQGLGREDSLAELEHSFNRKVLSGEITADIVEEEPRGPSLGREDSLAQLESSFHKQVMSGKIASEIAEGPNGPDNAPAPAAASVVLDVPKRRSSVAGAFPPGAPSPFNSARGMAPRGVSAEQVVVTDLPKRRASVAGGSPSAMQGPEPVVVDNFPKRRASVARPGGGSLAGLQVEGTPGAGTYDDDVSTMPASPEMLRQTSEMELLQTADSLGVEPVEASSVPKRRQSLTLSKSWMDAVAQERHPLAGATVSWEHVDDREGKSWWQCILCTPSEPSDSGASGEGDYKGDDDDEAAVSGMKPELWIKASGSTASTRAMDRPGKGDVCTIS